MKNIINFLMLNHLRNPSNFHHFQNLYDFVFSHSQAPEEFEITTNFPKRVIASGTATLQDVGLKDRDVLFVNDINA